jgi:hypothetical protein
MERHSSTLDDQTRMRGEASQRKLIRSCLLVAEGMVNLGNSKPSAVHLDTNFAQGLIHDIDRARELC